MFRGKTEALPSQGGATKPAGQGESSPAISRPSKRKSNKDSGIGCSQLIIGGGGILIFLGLILAIAQPFGTYNVDSAPAGRQTVTEQGMPASWSGFDENDWQTINGLCGQNLPEDVLKQTREVNGLAAGTWRWQAAQELILRGEYKKGSTCAQGINPWDCVMDGKTAATASWETQANFTGYTAKEIADWCAAHPAPVEATALPVPTATVTETKAVSAPATPTTAAPTATPASEEPETATEAKQGEGSNNKLVSERAPSALSCLIPSAAILATVAFGIANARRSDRSFIPGEKKGKAGSRRAQLPKQQADATLAGSEEDETLSSVDPRQQAIEKIDAEIARLDKLRFSNKIETFKIIDSQIIEYMKKFKLPSHYFRSKINEEAIGATDKISARIAELRIIREQLQEGEREV